MKAALLIFCVLFPVLHASAPTLTHGSIVGRPQPDSMRIWVRTSEPCAFRVRFDRQAEPGETSHVVEGHTGAERDNTGTVDRAGLQAVKSYF